MTNFDEHCVSRAYQFLVKMSRILLFALSVPAGRFVSTHQRDFSPTIERIKTVRRVVASN
jgi:hypothetical protein